MQNNATLTVQIILIIEEKRGGAAPSAPPLNPPMVVSPWGISSTWSLFKQVFFMLKRSAVNNLFIFYNKLDDLTMNAELIDEMLPPQKKNRSESRNERTWSLTHKNESSFKQQSWCVYQFKHLRPGRKPQNTIRMIIVYSQMTGPPNMAEKTRKLTCITL